jgi:hypothetical protein
MLDEGYWLDTFEANKNSNNDDKKKFELHLYNDYTNQAIVMVLDIKDLGRMFESLEEYFLKAQIEKSNE